jgi:hypothetical protein
MAYSTTGGCDVQRHLITLAVLLIYAQLGAGSAAADGANLDGDCCADLEERITELEATTARKGAVSGPISATSA